MHDDLRDLLANLVRLAIAPNSPKAPTWSDAANGAQRRIREAASHDDMHLDGNWNRAVSAAESDADVMQDATVNPTLPTVCPIDVADLMASPFDLDGVVAAIRSTSSFG